MVRNERYFRQIASSVLQMYYELETGNLPGGEFDVRALNYRIDVDRVLDHLQPYEQRVILAVHRDGDKAVLHGGTATVARIEAHLGRLFEKQKLLDLKGYLES